MKGNPTITSPPLLREDTFQQLLAAAQILQECSDRRVAESKLGCAGLSDGTIAESDQPVQVVPLTRQDAEAPACCVAADVIPIARTDVESFVPKNNSLIPPDTAYQLSVLASQLEALREAEIAPESELMKRMPIAEEQGEEQQIAADHVGIRESNSPHRVPRRRMFQSDELFWRSATVFGLAAILFLLLGISVRRISPLPGRLALPSEVIQQEAPFRLTIVPETSATTKPAASTVVGQPPVSEKISSSSQKAVVKPAYTSDTDIVAAQNTKVASEVQKRIRADRRLQMTRVQVWASNGIVTLSGDVGSDAQRVAAAQDAAHIGGVEALVNSLRVITNPHSPTGALQKSSASVVPIVRDSAVESSPAETFSSSSTSPNTTASSEDHPTGSGVFSVSSSSSLVSNSAMNTPPAVPEQITVPDGTVLAVRLTEKLSSGLNQPGDTFLASLASPVVIGGRVIIPEGAGVKGTIVDARNARRLSGRSALVIEVTHLAYNGRTYELRSSQYSKQGASRNAYAAAAITGGTGVGAILGTIIGRGRGAAIGAVMGAAAGTGIQAVTKAAPAELSAESMLSLRLEAPLKVIPSSTLQQAQSAGPDFSQDPFSSDDRPVLKQRLDTLPNANTPRSSPTSNKDSRQTPSQWQPPHN